VYLGHGLGRAACGMLSGMALQPQRQVARETFDEVAALYDEARPGYPDAVYDDLIALAGVSPASHLLEIGSGTGHATLPLARRGFRIDCVELGQQMATVAHAKLAGFSGVTTIVADFDQWTAGTRYNLAFSAGAYHWLSPQTRVQRIAALLSPGGRIAVFRNHHVQGEASARINRAVQSIYTNIFPDQAQAKVLLRAEDVAPTEAQEWLASGLFARTQTRVYRWQQQLTAEEHVRMLATHSDHRLLSEVDRACLFDRLIRLIESEFNGIALKEYVTLLQMTEKIC
jgi:trans-aconitate methyltransferase